jgi:Holliday junction resolvase
MTGRKSKEKGKRGERELCSLLTNFFEKPFLRVPNSGSFLGGKNIKREKKIDDSQKVVLKGDIIPPDKFENLLIECKNYKNINFLKIFNGNNSTIDSWIRQCLDIVHEKNVWFICFKITNRGWFSIVPEKFFSFEIFSGNYMIYKYNQEKYIIVSLSSFLETHRKIIEQKLSSIS